MSGLYIPNMNYPREGEVICVFSNGKVQKRIVELSTLYEVIETSGAIPVPRPSSRQTNADRIRSMTDEELAALFTQDVFDDKPCFYCPVNIEDCDLSTDCKKCFLDWLREEAKT